MSEACITVKDLTMTYGDFVIQRDLNFTINRGDVFVVMGGNGCGKTTLLRHMIGLKAPAQGDVYYGEQGLWQADPKTRERILARTGVLFQSGALLSSMTLAENVALPITEATTLPAQKVREIVSYKLALVGLAGFEDYYPSELSGGMQKRAGLARAMAMDPEILFFDEPSAGLDPITAKLLDDLILSLSNALSATIVVVTHDLDSIFAIGNNSVFLDAETHTMIAGGPPRQLLEQSADPSIVRFLTRGEQDGRHAGKHIKGSDK
ncbi:MULTISPECIES: ABC transporter ATP-binding protein [Methylomonas]|uniref:Polyamine ABC transporter ATP-binding protein n=1 Tax=Methylomonas koyamae TaxID=702114 RepID=A0A177NTR9_9GAMM|nr:MULTISPECIES: ATP-binding cassette domain-containing protein [Methylomonas]ANE55112.1 polyamine ABC transporter ATP-binding protein [Methylomonas sp. DH-1]OAI20954.1 polyamine ABC transporter ATP-binding protein [Methylomonas koyamae]OAI29807.1 polyamine ABC transporter ATP-binding protein [Methylomonas koyamae]